MLLINYIIYNMPSSNQTPLQPRVPTAHKKDELWRCLCEEQKFEMLLEGEDEASDASNIRDCINNAAIAVFDHYITDCVGYSGKVMCVVWSGAPEMHEVFIWETRHTADVVVRALTRANWK